MDGKVVAVLGQVMGDEAGMKQGRDQTSLGGALGFIPKAVGNVRSF